MDHGSGRDTGEGPWALSTIPGVVLRAAEGLGRSRAAGSFQAERSALRRIAANLLGVVRTSAEPFPHLDYSDGGTVDTED